MAGLFGGGAKAPEKTFPVTRTEAEWRARLTPEQYYILREHGTERAGTCALNFEKRPGVFSCAGCDQDLFIAKAKFESDTGWPSFFDPLPGASYDAQPFEYDESCGAINFKAGDQLVFRYTAANTTSIEAYIPNGDGVHANGRIPSIHLP